MSKNKSILDLQTAQSPARTISTTLNIPVCNVYHVYHVIKEGRVERKARGPPLNKNLNPRFLDKLATAVNKAPTVSIWLEKAVKAEGGLFEKN
jgi:hypothetical protein